MSKAVLAYLCVTNSWGGLEMNQLRNALWMKQRNHEVLLLGLKDSRITNESEKLNITTIHIARHRKYYDFKRALELSKILKKQGATHLIIRDPKDISLGVTTKRLMRNSIHVSYFMEMQLGIKKTDFIHTLRFKGLDLWSCPLNFLARQVHELTNYDPQKIRIIPSGMDISKFENLPSSKEAREKLNLSQDKILIGLIGRLDPFKGQMLVLDAYESLPEEIKSKLEIVFLGDKMSPDIDDFYNRLTTRVKEPGFSKNVTILPFRDDVALFYAAMDATIMASKAETFGMVTIESMASGTPVIGSNAGGTTELIGNNERGILFETMNVDSLKSAFIRFIENNRVEKKKLISYAEKYDHCKVCKTVEKELGLN
jgi:glycosyltransferase involved in cell wall biosynthesis